ncbi:MAG: IgGFc-binding protein [Myxococcales bacterium]|nr:IgGFc-binding protein [Myxococcales bacterium]
MKKHAPTLLRALATFAATGLFMAACGSEGRDPLAANGADGGANASICGSCTPAGYSVCDASGQPRTETCMEGTVCVPNKGCLACAPGGTVCVGNDIHACTNDGKPGDKTSSCDPSKGQVCQGGLCTDACTAAAQMQSNLGCEFWAVDLDITDITTAAMSPWGVVLSSASEIPAEVTIEQNDAPYGAPPNPRILLKTTLQPGQLITHKLPPRAVDCGKGEDDHNAPGTCLSSNAFRITASAPIVAYQFNNFVHHFATDASLLLPTSVLGTKYRNIGWGAGTPYANPIAWTTRSYVTVIGTKPGTTVTVNPSWRIKGNGPIKTTNKGEPIQVTLGPFDVLNLESDDAKPEECFNKKVGDRCTDLTSTVIQSSAPVAVFSGVESSGVGLPEGAPEPPSWKNLSEGQSKGCCKQHLEEQLPPLEAVGRKFVITRSPIRSDSDYTNWVEPDVLRFVGAAVPSNVRTNLPKPYDYFTILPGQIVETWTDKDVIVDATEPILVGQFLIAQDYVEPNPKGDPSFTIFPPVEQARNEYLFLSPGDWKENWIVVSTEAKTNITIDGQPLANCTVAPAGDLDGKTYEARRCKVAGGVHRMSGTGPFGIMAYGYDDADVYAFPGGAFVKKIYEPPPIK